MYLRVKIGCGVISALLVIGLRFFWLSPDAARGWVMHGAYWFCCLLALAGLFLLIQSFQCCSGLVWAHIKKEKLWLGTALVLSVLMQVHEPHLLKVNYDEHVLLGLSRSMHYEHIAAWPASAMLYDGSVVPTSLMVDKRPCFFPFVLSVFHTVLGFRLENVFIVNWLSSFFLFLGLYHLGRIYGGHWGGLLASVLMASLPLIAQNATGGGYDLFNLALVVFLVCRVTSYLTDPSGRNLLVVVLIAVILANTRYESLSYSVVPCLCFLYVVVGRKKVPEVPWVLVVAPLGLLWPLLSNAVFYSHPGFFQTTTPSGFFDVNNISHNLPYALYYLFDFSRGGTNSVWLASLGVLALVIGGVLMGSGLRKRQPIHSHVLALCIVGAVIVGNTVLILMLSWGEWTDPNVSRFALPFCLFLTLSIVATLGGLLIKSSAWRFLALASVGVVFLFAVPDAAQASATHKFKASWGLSWSIDFLRKYDPDRAMLIMATSAIPYMNHGYPALSLGRSQVETKDIEFVLRFGLYQGLVMVIEQRRSRTDGTWQCDAATLAMLNRVHFSLVGERVLDPFYRMQIIRVDGMLQNSDAIKWPAQNPHEDGDAYRRRVYKLMPSM